MLIEGIDSDELGWEQKWDPPNINNLGYHTVTKQETDLSTQKETILAMHRLTEASFSIEVTNEHHQSFGAEATFKFEPERYEDLMTYEEPETQNDNDQKEAETHSENSDQ